MDHKRTKYNELFLMSDGQTLIEINVYYRIELLYRFFVILINYKITVKSDNVASFEIVGAM